MINIFDKEIKDVNLAKNTDLIFYFVSKREIINKDYKRLENSLATLSKAGKAAKNKLFLCFSGYDNDEREIYMINEIRDFVKHVYNNYKHMFYFISPINDLRRLVFACLNDFQNVKRDNEINVALQIIVNKEIQKETISGMMKYGLIIDDLKSTKEIILQLFNVAI